MNTSESVIRRLGDVNKLTLKMERETTKLQNPQDLGITNVLGSAYEELESLLNSRDLSIDSAWERLHSIADNLETAIDKLRKQLG
jgi:hypothetical protein